MTFILAYLLKDTDDIEKNRVINLTGNKVYADLCMLINFVMDAVILWTSAKLTGLEIRWGRLSAAALLGAVYAVVFLFDPFSLLHSLSIKLLFSFVLILVAFYPLKWSDLKKALLYFYMISFMAAGAITGLPYLVKEILGYSRNPWWLMIGIAVLLWLGWQGPKYLANQVIPKILSFLVRIKLNGQEISGKGFLDTGNMLRDPLTDRPVLIAEYDWLKKYLPYDLMCIFENAADDTELLNSAAQSSWAGKLRIIPFHSIGRQNGFLLGIRSDEIRINFGNKNINCKNLIIAVYQEKLSRDGDYQLLIPAEIARNA